LATRGAAKCCKGGTPASLFDRRRTVLAETSAGHPYLTQELVSPAIDDFSKTSVRSSDAVNV
jgi:hypothetical protein